MNDQGMLNCTQTIGHQPHGNYREENLSTLHGLLHATYEQVRNLRSDKGSQDRTGKTTYLL